jgi:protoheme IX farnesyltransferase
MMSVTSARLEPSIAGVGDYIELMKPRVIRAGIPMLPVVAGESEARRQILYDALVLVPLGIALWPLSYTGPFYGIAAIVIGVAMIALALRVRCETSGYDACKHLFALSFLYLFLLFAVLLVDRMSGGPIGHFAA